MEQAIQPCSLLDYLAMVPDPRRRQGRIYPLVGILAMLILAALNGQKSLRGMWIWAQKHWELFRKEMALGFWAVGRLPCLTEIWNILTRLNTKALEEAITAWAKGWGCEEAISVDGKVLRGSKRKGLAALQVITAASQAMHTVLRQQGVEEGDMVAAAIELLKAIPLEGKVVSLDAGLLQRKVVEVVVEKRGPTLGH